LPLIRVIQDDAVPPELMTRSESARLDRLRAKPKDRNDIPSATLSMILGAFYLTNDGPALRAAYGEHASLSTRDQWQQILKAGGDAGELGTAMQMGFGLAAVLGSAGFSAIKALYRLAGPAGIAAVGGLAYAGYRRTGNTTKEKIGSGAMSVLLFLGELLVEYQDVQGRFERAAPAPPTWEEQAAELSDEAILARACMHTLARVGRGHCSARELRGLLPALPVPSGEAKVRQVLRALPACFNQVYAGRWQVGEVADPVTQLLDRMPELAIG